MDVCSLHEINLFLLFSIFHFPLCCPQTAPEGAFASADALLSRLAHPASLCGALDYLEPDLAEKNPPVFAQKLQVCSPCVTFWEFVKTSVENEPLSQIELRQDLTRQYWNVPDEVFFSQ